jgi:outer membrane protein assembly factor BamE (lipoprotein component of BamABCDE complex)
MGRSRVPAGTLVAIVAASILLTGCLVTSKSNVQYSGKEVGERTLSRLVVGETTREWLISELGEPTATQTRNGAEVLSYQSRRSVEKRSGFFLLYHNEVKEEQVTTVYFEFRDGVLERYWTE